MTIAEVPGNWPIVNKAAAQRVAANMGDYATTRATFTWRAARDDLGLPGSRLNIADATLSRQIWSGGGDHLALRWLGKDGASQDFRYCELDKLSSRFANLLRRHGVKGGDRVFCLLGRIPALYVAALGTWKAGCVFAPLFSAFGPEPVRARMEIGEATVLITSEAFYRKKVMAWCDQLPSLRLLLIAGGLSAETPPGLVDLDAAMAEVSDAFDSVATSPDDVALVHFTSGTTGRPKGAVHVHEAVVAHYATGRFVLDLKPEDVFWCTADPGWVTGTSYGIIAPLAVGATMIVDEADFEAERWYGILQEQRVTVWYTAPTAIRMMMKVGTEVVRKYDTSSLRFMASVGEPLNPEGVMWGLEAFGKPFHDNWWQTETGGIMVANFASMDVRPGSMGRPVPGVEAAIVRREGDVVTEIGEPMTVGELALRPGWPSMFRGYLHEEERYRKCFAGGWYLTGDLAMRDADGYYWFVGRADDVIKSAGHLIGPFEVESTLMEHPAVAEAGVIGVPDPVAGEEVKAFVALKVGFNPSEALRRDILALARKRLGRAVAPREVEFRPNLPKTRSGKIMRRLLKARELGLPEGDLSTLESDQ